MAVFPSNDWISILQEKLNNDEHYAQVARNWEGDMLFVIAPDESLPQEVRYYLDLWHGACRDAYVVPPGDSPGAAFKLEASYGNYKRLLEGKTEPMQALLTRKIGVQGNMAVLMRNVPTVLDFVRCCREVTDGYAA